MLIVLLLFFFLMIRRPPRSTLDRSSAASDVYKRQDQGVEDLVVRAAGAGVGQVEEGAGGPGAAGDLVLSLIHISEPTRPY